MAIISITDALKEVMESTGWKLRIHEIRLKRDWESIVGKTIARYTASISLKKGTLYIYTTIAPLKQELQYARENLIQNINEFYNEKVVHDIIIK